MAPETIKIHQKSMPRSRPRKNMFFFFEKRDAPDCQPDYRFGGKKDPRWHPKIMNKSIPKKYAKMKAKGSKRYGKWCQNGFQNHEKIDTRFDVEK